MATIRDTWLFKKTIGKQPYRFVFKSIRNVFLPENGGRTTNKGIAIEVSSICNARCIFCPYRFNYRSKKLMRLDSFIKIAKSAVELGYVNLDLTSPGGELFLHKDAVKIIEEAKAVGFKHIGTYTNGVPIAKHNLDKLLISGIDVLIISFPGFDGHIFEEVFGVNKYREFEYSIIKLLQKHRELNSEVIIIFEPRTYLTLRQIKESQFYKNFLSGFIGERVILREPLRVFDSWGGEIRQPDLIRGMKVDKNPFKSIYPLKKVYLCNRLLSIGVLANGDVRLCNCRYDSTIETGKDSLFIDNLKNHDCLADLLIRNEHKISQIKSNFIHGKLPALCAKCPFYIPIKVPDKMDSIALL